VKYLLDTNICIHYNNGDHGIPHKLEIISPENCFISEITVAEMKYGVEASTRKNKNSYNLDRLLTKIKVIPFVNAIETFAREKAELKRNGKMIENFDIVIAATAIAHNLTLVTDDVAFDRFENLRIENWIRREPVIRHSKSLLYKLR
jgi:tRNA(fMet)-specific endonuclease VapC